MEHLQGSTGRSSAAPEPMTIIGRERKLRSRPHLACLLTRRPTQRGEQLVEDLGLELDELEVEASGCDRLAGIGADSTMSGWVVQGDRSANSSLRLICMFSSGEAAPSAHFAWARTHSW